MLRSLLLAALALTAQAQELPDARGLFDGSAEALPLALPEAEAVPAKGKAVEENNVILITWDGVRLRDVLANASDPAIDGSDKGSLLPNLHGTLIAQGAFYGDLKAGNQMSVANVFGVSLPAYQSIFAGRMTTCRNNDCGRVKTQTFPERLVKELKLPKEKVAAIASWEKLAFAVEEKAGTITVDVDAHTRPDPDTWARAMAYLQAHQPRFLYISLNDADDHGHAGDYKAYIASMRQYDAWLKALIDGLGTMGEYGKKTTVIVTTDHSRGEGADWRNHGGRPTSYAIWLYARGPSVPALGHVGACSSPHSHAAIRPTVETLLGLKPPTGLGREPGFPEALGGSSCTPSAPTARTAPKADKA